MYSITFVSEKLSNSFLIFLKILKIGDSSLVGYEFYHISCKEICWNLKLTLYLVKLKLLYINLRPYIWGYQSLFLVTVDMLAFLRSSSSSRRDTTTGFVVRTDPSPLGPRYVDNRYLRLARVRYDIMHWSNKNNKPGMTLAADFEAAFESIAWNYLNNELDDQRIELRIKFPAYKSLLLL